MALECSRVKKRTYSNKRFWVAPVFQERARHGFFHAVWPVMISNAVIFQNYFRMDATQFEDLLTIVAPSITKQHTFGEPIYVVERLSLTLRFLASGDSMRSITNKYLIGVTSLCNVIEKTCDALWDCLHDEVLKSKLQADEWLNISDDFEKQWNFKHCVGAIGGKHVLIQCPDNEGSSYYNYKNTHSIVLLGICDANYKFSFVDIGAYGRRSDGGIFRDSIMGQAFENREMNLPASEPFSEEGPPLPYVLVGDKAFPLKSYLLRPYAGKGRLNEEKNIYNYRLSRARRTIENTFGILVSQWRILKRPIDSTVDKTMKIVKAIVCLHNWIRQVDNNNHYVPPSLIDQDNGNVFIPGSWRQLINNSALQNVTRAGTNNSTRTAIEIRNEFCRYFNSEGAVP